MIEKMRVKLFNEMFTSLAMVFATAKGLTILKIKASLKIAIAMGFFVRIVEAFTGWFMENQVYVAVVLFAIAIDHILGTVRHIAFDRNFTFKKNASGFIIKVTLVVFVGSLFEQLNFIAGSNLITGYTTTVLRLTVFLYPAGSAIGNARIISNGRFPPAKIYDWLEKFTENINTKSINNESK